MNYVIGQRIPRHDAVLQVTGRAEYGVDLIRPGMLFARVLRSPHYHARILNLDTSRAESLPGVAAVITAPDVPNNRFGFTHLDQPLLAEDMVRYREEPIAAVAADAVAGHGGLSVLRHEDAPAAGALDDVVTDDGVDAQAAPDADGDAAGSVEQ